MTPEETFDFDSIATGISFTEPEAQKTEEESEEQEITEEQDKPADDDAPNFEKPQRKQKQDKQESLAALKKRLESEQEKNKGFTELFQEHTPDSIKPLFDFITSKIEGPVTTEAVTELINEIQEKDRQIDELNNKFQETEKKVNDLDIRYSDSFKSKYEQPYRDSAQALTLEFANVDPDGKLIGPKSTEHFDKFLKDNVDSLVEDGTKVKGALVQFAKLYKEETGEDASLPTFSSLMSSLRSFKKSRNDMKDAYENWQTKKAESEREHQTRQAEEQEKLQKQTKKERSNLASKAYREFDHDSYDFIEDSELQSFFKEEFQFGEKIFAGESVPPYDELIIRGVESRLWRKHGSRLKELLELEAKVKAGSKNGLKGQDMEDINFKGKDDVHFLDKRF